MSDAPSPESTRAALRELDARGRKIAIGLFSVMITEPMRVKDREWMSQKLTEVTLLAGGLEADAPDATVRAVQESVREHAPQLLRAAFTLFQRVGLDLAERAPDGKGLEFADALQGALDYLPPGDDEGNEADGRPHE